MKIYFTLLFLALNVQATTIAIISDMNGSYGSTTYHPRVSSAIKKIISLKPDMVLSTGDMVAGQKSGLDYKMMWKSFHQTVTEPLLQNEIPFAVAVGNHDGSAFSPFRIERKEFEDQWKNKNLKLNFIDESDFPFNYAFTHDELLYIALDSTSLQPQTAFRLLWLENILLQYQHKKHKILFTHVPMFEFSQMPSSESFFDQELFLLLKKYKVHFYLSGHHHAYYPGYLEGTHFISQACLGSGARKLRDSEQISKNSFTLIEIDHDKIQIQALLAPDYKFKENIESFPQTIQSHGHLIKTLEKSIITH